MHVSKQILKAHVEIFANQKTHEDVISCDKLIIKT